MSNYVAFQVTSKKDVIDTVIIDGATSKIANSNFDVVATCAKSNLEFNEDSHSNSGDGKEPYKRHSKSLSDDV